MKKKLPIVAALFAAAASALADLYATLTGVGTPYDQGGAGGMRRHAVLVDAEGNVTLDGWTTVSPLSSLTITGFTLDPDGTATITFEGDGDLASVTNSLSVDVSATPDFTTLLVPALTNLVTSGATGSFKVGKPEGDHSALFYRVQGR